MNGGTVLDAETGCFKERQPNEPLNPIGTPACIELAPAGD
jgi:hypothetical protein